ncbi:MAG: DUF1302 family protein [Candidatus Neomarinimicrobiota bacterium]
MQKLLSSLLLLAVAAAGADINGYLKGFAFLNPHDRTYDRIGTRFQTRYSGGLGTRMEYFAAINFEFDQAAARPDTLNTATENDLGRGAGFGVYPVEYYLDLHLAAADIRLGQQFIFWGAADWVNPTDLINPWDYANMSGEIEDYRLPVMALSVQWYLGDLTLQGVLIPGFTPAVMPLPPDAQIAYPQLGYDEPQLGFRATSYLGNTDISICYFNGYDNLPTIRSSMDLSVLPPVPVFNVNYHSLQMFGLDFIRPIDAWNIKGEAAYLQTADEGGNDVFVDNRNIQAVLGVDYIWSDDLLLNLQYVNRTLLDYQYSSEQGLIDNLGLTDYLTAPEKSSHSLSTMISWKPFAYVSGRLLGVYNLQAGDSFTMAFLTWELADATHLTAGAVLFQGAENTTYGRMDQEDKLFIELKRSF